VSLPVLAEAQNFAYFGERGDWLVAYSRHRDSDTLGQSNFRTFLAHLGGKGPDVAVEQMSSDMVGWVDHLLVRPGSDAERRAVELHEKLADYPVLDEDDLSDLEHEQHLDHEADALRWGFFWSDCSVCEGDMMEAERINCAVCWVGLKPDRNAHIPLVRLDDGTLVHLECEEDDGQDR
jgi:hypothetical protein